MQQDYNKHVTVGMLQGSHNIHTLPSSCVMAVCLCEQVKCARYWPDTSMSQSTVYEDLEVVTRSRTTTQDFTTTTFLLRHREVNSFSAHRKKQFEFS